MKRLPEFESLVEPLSRTGIGAIALDSSPICRMGQIKMIVTSEGYVGLTRLDANRLAVAAAVDRDLLSQLSPGHVVLRILSDANINLADTVQSANWQGTPPLTSRPNRLADHRIFVIGDAGGYVEPFTGEGITTYHNQCRD